MAARVMARGSRPGVGRAIGRAVATSSVVLAVALAVAGCAGSGASGASTAPVPVTTNRPAMTVTPTVALTRAELARALGERNLVLSDSQAALRPAESPLLGAAPRAVYQVQLPKDPTKGFIVVYEFRDALRAADAAAEQQAYRATGPGRVQTPQGTVTIIRQVGSTVLLYEWLPGASLDPSAAGIQTALETLGVGYPIPG
jgi:hypothetical protein